jgi:DNA-binding NtrC family response regulator
MMAEGDIIDVRDLPDYLQGREPAPELEFGETPLPLEEMERRYIARVLQQMGGNKVQTARILGISRAKLYSILRESSPVAEQPCALRPTRVGPPKIEPDDR